MKKSPTNNRRGAVVVLTALLLVALLAMVGFAVDVGYIVHARTELQRTADACSLAAVAELPEEVDAKVTAYNYSVNNHGSVGPALDFNDIEIGYWDRDTATFNSPAPPGENNNAVRVRLNRTAAAGNPLPLFFGHLLSTDAADVTATATAMYDNDLCGPLVGIDWVSVPGNPSTDSYKSDEGPYNPGFARDKGGLCSDGPVSVEGQAFVNGSARAGKGHNVTLEGSATVTGSIGSRKKPLNMPPVDASQAELINDNLFLPLVPEGKGWKSPVDANGNFLLDGTKTYDMPPGTYYFNNFTVKGQSTLNLSGETTIYVTGNLERSGGTFVNNNTQIPSNLKFLMTQGTANVTSNNDFHGVIYGPNTNIRLDGDSDLFGVVVGKTLTATGSGAAHYDESLDLDEVDFPRRTALVD